MLGMLLHRRETKVAAIDAEVEIPMDTEKSPRSLITLMLPWQERTRMMIKFDGDCILNTMFHNK